MARIRHTNSFFNIGYINESIRGNVKYEQYNDALTKCINAYTSPTGGLMKRAGTIHMSTTENKVRNIVFAFATGVEYIVEFSHHKIRFNTREGYLTIPDGEGGYKIYEYDTTIDEEDLDKIYTCQLGSIMYITYDKGLSKLVRVGAVDDDLKFDYYDSVIFSVPPMTPRNREPVSLLPSAATGVIELTPVDSSYKTGPIIYPDDEFAPVFYGSDVSGYVLLSYDDGVEEAKHYYLLITAVTPIGTTGFNKAVCSIDVEKSFSDTLPDINPMSMWYISAFSTDRGFPKITFAYEGRLYFANTKKFPLVLWGSSLMYDDKTNFNIGSQQAGDAITFEPALPKADQLIWVEPQTKLFIGTQGGIYIAGGATSHFDDPVTPTNFRIKMFEAVGASNLRPLPVMDTIFFVDSGGQNVHDITLSVETGSYSANNLSVISNDVTSDGIVDHCWHPSKNRYWCVTKNGRLVSLTYKRNQGVLSWSQDHTLGGKNPVVESVCLYRENEKEYVVLSVKRDRVDSQGYIRTIEYLNEFDPVSQESFKQYYVDCGSVYEEKEGINAISKTSILSFGEVDSTHFSNYGLCKVELDNTSIEKGEALPETSVFRYRYDYGLKFLSLYGVTTPKLEGNSEIGFPYDGDVEYAPLPTEVFEGFVTANTVIHPRLGNITGIESIGATTFVYFNKIDAISTGEKVFFCHQGKLFSSILTKLSVEEVQDFIPDFRFTQYEGIVGKNNLIIGEKKVFNNKTGFFLKYLDPDDSVVKHIDSSLWPSRAKDFWKGFLLFSSGVGHNGFLNSAPAAVTFNNSVEEIATRTGIYEVYINKAPGIKDINKKKYNFSFTSNPDKKSVFLYEPVKTVLAGSELVVCDLYNEIVDYGSHPPIETEYYGNYDTQAAERGSGYFYFDRIAIPDILSTLTLDKYEMGLNVNGGTIGMSSTEYDWEGGLITLPVNAMYAALGLKYAMEVETIDFVGGSMFGDSDGCMGAQKATVIRLYYSSGGKYALNSSSTIYDIKYPVLSLNTLNFDNVPELYTGLVDLKLGTSSSKYQKRIFFFHDEPLSFNILSVTMDVDTSDA